MPLLACLSWRRMERIRETSFTFLALFGLKSHSLATLRRRMFWLTIRCLSAKKKVKNKMGPTKKKSSTISTFPTQFLVPPVEKELLQMFCPQFYAHPCNNQEINSTKHKQCLEIQKHKHYLQILDGFFKLDFYLFVARSLSSWSAY